MRETMAWESYNLDREAHELVVTYRDKKDALNQAYKMRVTVTYGLERFWGEQWRLDAEKANYWKDVWKTFAKIVKDAGIEIPCDEINASDKEAVQRISSALWDMKADYRKVSLAILTQFCDSLVWWTQRYKKSGGDR